MTQEALRKVTSFLQREQGERAPERADTVCVCSVCVCSECVLMCVLFDGNLYVVHVAIFDSVLTVVQLIQ